MEHIPPNLAPHFLHGLAVETTLAARVGAAEVDRLAGLGALTRPARGILAYTGALDPWTPLALIQLRRAGVLGGARLASWAHGFQPFAGRQAHATDLLSRRPSREPGVVVRRDLVAADVVTIAGLRFTSPARTLADLGDVTDAESVERAVESALRRRQVHESDLWAIVARLRRPGRHGPAVLGRVLERRGRGTPVTDSDLEMRFVLLARRLGFPDPTWRQYPVERVGRDPYRVDFVWDNGRYLVFVEIDGDGTHANPEALTSDLARQNFLERSRPVLLRFTRHHVDHTPEHVDLELGQHLYNTGSKTAPAPAVTAPRRPRADGSISAA